MRRSIFHVRRIFPLVLFVIAVAISFLYLFDLRHLSAPAYYGGDALYYLQLIKNVTLFGTPYWGEVGAPFPPELWLFPGVTISWVIIMKTLALFTDDVFVITNSFALVVTILN